ncbi:MAG TPA: YbaK/EbsC family protein, partial [Leifsonia sp.]
IQPSDIVKTLVVKRSDDTFVFVLVPGGRKISWPKLRALLGVNKLQLPDASVALAATGYERGTITPFGSTTSWPVVADATVPGRTVSLGAGERGHTLFVDSDALIAAFAATVADVTDPE